MLAKVLIATTGERKKYHMQQKEQTELITENLQNSGREAP
jgi:hypothetical protein